MRGRSPSGLERSKKRRTSRCSRINSAKRSGPISSSALASSARAVTSAVPPRCSARSPKLLPGPRRDTVVPRASVVVTAPERMTNRPGCGAPTSESVSPRATSIGRACPAIRARTGSGSRSQGGCRARKASMGCGIAASDKDRPAPCWARDARLARGERRRPSFGVNGRRSPPLRRAGCGRSRPAPGFPAAALAWPG